MMPATDEGNLCAVLRLFAAWRTCGACGLRVLFVDERAQHEGTFYCGRCLARTEALAESCRPKVRPPTIMERAVLHLHGLLATANDNAAVLS